MEIFVKPEVVSTNSYPADGKVNIAFMEDQKKGSRGNVFVIQLNRDLAHALIGELGEFCRRAGHPLYQKGLA